MIARLYLLFVVLFALALPARAENPDRFRPSGSAHDGSGALQLVHPTVGGQWGAYAGGFVVDSENLDTDPTTRRMTAAHLGAGLSLTEFLRVDLALPAYFTIVTEDAAGEPETFAGGALGDFRVGLTVPVVPASAGRVGLGFAPWLDAPTGDVERGTGDGQAGGGAVLTIGGGGGAQTGWRLNAGVTGGAFGAGGRFGAGFDHPVRNRTRLGAEFVADQSFGEDGPRTVEAHAVAQMRGPGATTGTFVVGTGLTPDAGSPALRLALGVSWHKVGASDDPDGDGIPSDRDACPWTPEDNDGWNDRDGCPEGDNDGDGVPDEIDLCPDEVEDRDGYLDRDGCIDADNDFDGLLDDDDDCPLQAGPTATGGCPDGDGDGVPDIDDECPVKKGPADSFGCPDWDGDRVPDDRDRCPTRPADPTIDPKRSDGCPATAWRGYAEILYDEPVYFAFNRAGVDPRSVPMLLEVARIIENSPDILLVEVAGHADEVGSEGYNLRLSRLRAAAVRDVLVKQGGIDPNRVIAVGYGEEQPAASNRTNSGRAENRRVEFLIRRTVEPADAKSCRDRR